MAEAVRTIELQVADAPIADVAEGRARISREDFEALGLTPGSIVEIERTDAILADAYPAGLEDDGLGVVRLDGTQRRRLGVRLGDTVVVRRYDAITAERIRCLALGSSRALELSPYDIHKALLDCTVRRGDTFAISPARRDFEAKVSLLGLNVMDVVGSSAGAHTALVRIVETTPPGVVRVLANTEVEILSAGDAGDEDES